MSKAEYERLRREEGILTERPPRDEVEWTNPRTGKTVRVDRGLDPSWAGNPGRDRERILLDRMAAALTATTTAIPAAAAEALVREAVRGVVESPLLDRHFDPFSGARGDLPLAVLERRWSGLFSRPVETWTVRLPKRIAEKQAKHPEIVREAYLRVEELLRDNADFVVHQTQWEDPGGGTHQVDDLVFVLRMPGGPQRLVLRRYDSRNVSLVTWHRIRPPQVKGIRAKGDVVWER